MIPRRMVGGIMHLMAVARWTGSGLVTGALALALAPAVAAQGLSAIVESVSPAREDVRAFDILAEGTVIELKPGGKLVLGYMESCAHEEITGGKVTIGAAESKVEGGTVEHQPAEIRCVFGRTVLKKGLHRRDLLQGGGTDGLSIGGQKRRHEFGALHR